jgi:Gas vesicle protein G
MGLLKSLALLPLAPVGGVVWVARQLQQEAYRQLSDPDLILEQLAILERELEAGEIDEQEFVDAEEILLDRLDELQIEMEAR